MMTSKSLIVFYSFLFSIYLKKKIKFSIRKSDIQEVLMINGKSTATFKFVVNSSGGGHRNLRISHTGRRPPFPSCRRCASSSLNSFTLWSCSFCLYLMYVTVYLNALI